MRLIRLCILGLAGYGAYVLWNQYGGTVKDAPGKTPDDPRISARAELTVEEAAVGSDDPVAQAAAILADSDDRELLPRDAPGVERRRSEDTVEL